MDDTTPAFRRVELRVQVVSNEIECLSLITQVLALYPSVDREWIGRCLERTPYTGQPEPGLLKG